MTTATADDIRSCLEEAGERRAQADQARDEAMHDIHRLLCEGLDAELSISEMARLAGISRQTVYDLLDEGC